MRLNLRTTLLSLAALMAFFAAYTMVAVSVPHLRDDLIEINVRPTLLDAVVRTMSFATFAMFGFAGIICCSAIHSAMKKAIARIPLAIIGVLYTAFGAIALAHGASHHMAGYVLIGLLCLASVFL